MNHDEKTIQEQLKKNADIPSVVLDKVSEAYRMIEEKKITQKAPQPQRSSSRWIIHAAEGMAAALAVCTILCVSNPAMASKLPLVGRLFEKLQDHVSFSGNFSDHAQILEEPADENSDNAAPQTDNGHIYTKTCDGLTITFSEVYADKQAIYLTMMAESEEPFPETMIMQNPEIKPHPIISMQINSYYSFLENQDESSSFILAYPEGIFLDDHTYSCILRLDLPSVAQDTSEYEEKYNAMTQEVMEEMGVTLEDLNDETEEGYALLSQFVDEVSARGGALQSYIKDIPIPDSFHLKLDITEVTGTKAEPEVWDSGYTQEELEAMSDEERQKVMDQMPAEYMQHPNPYENYWYEGSWSFDIPITIDNSQTVTLELNDVNEEGIGLKSVVKTPYEITVYEQYEEGSNADTFMVALDADGNKLPYNDSNGNCNNFTIQDRDISTVDIYILDYVQYMDELKGPERYYNNENKPVEEKWSTLLAANAKYHTTVHFDP